MNDRKLVATALGIIVALAAFLAGALWMHKTMQKDAVTVGVADWVANKDTGAPEFRYKQFKP